MFNIGNLLEDQKHLVYDKDHTLKFIIDKRKMLIGNDEAFLLSISPVNITEQTHAKATENKYSQLIVATVTHDLKSPIARIQGNLDVLEQYIKEEGVIHLKAAQVAATAFEYYLYDLVVYLVKA